MPSSCDGKETPRKQDNHMVDCEKCCSRWERISEEKQNARLLSASAMKPTGNTMCLFGKHKGLSYDDLLMSHPDYCQWVVQTRIQAPDSSPSLCQLADHIMESQEIPAQSLTAESHLTAIPIHSSDDDDMADSTTMWNIQATSSLHPQA